MQRVSTNLTLFYKVFIPTFWIIFFGSLMVTTFVYKDNYLGTIPGEWLRYGSILFFVVGLALLFLTLLRLKRVEMDKDLVYITNYFQHFKYPWSNIEKINEHKFFYAKIVTIKFKVKGNFGKQITFVASNKLFRFFKEDHPDIEQLKK